MSAIPGLERSRIVKPVAVAVEGGDYLYMLLGQIKNDPDLQDVQLWDFKGREGGDLLRWLRLFTTLDGYRQTIRALGIIRDAEADARRCFQSTCQAFRGAGLEPPQHPMEVGTARPAVGVLLMPHGKPSGCLEHAMLEAAGPGVPLHCAEDYLQCVGADAANDNWNAKVKVHALIAAAKNPAWTLSESALGGMWDFGHPSLAVMKAFMRRLSSA